MTRRVLEKLWIARGNATLRAGERKFWDRFKTVMSIRLVEVPEKQTRFAERSKLCRLRRDKSAKPPIGMSVHASQQLRLIET